MWMCQSYPHSTLLNIIKILNIIVMAKNRIFESDFKDIIYELSNNFGYFTRSEYASKQSIINVLVHSPQQETEVIKYLKAWFYLSKRHDQIDGRIYLTFQEGCQEA